MLVEVDTKFGEIYKLTKLNPAIETILQALENKDIIINTMQSEFERLEDLEDTTDELKLSLKNSISKDKIKEKIEKNNKKLYGSAFISTRYENKLKIENVILQELLEENE